MDKDKAIDTTPIKEFVKYVHSLEDRIVALEEVIKKLLDKEKTA